MTRSPALRPGDTIGFISPSRPSNRRALDRAVAWTEAQGFTTWVSPHADASYHYLGGRDEIRAAAVMEAFTRHDIRAVVCTRGGYGSGRVLSRLDYDTIGRHPKPFVGFSDSTGLHLALAARCGLVGITGALADTDLSTAAQRPRTIESLMHLLTSTQPLPPVPAVTLRGGEATGPLFPVNLALLSSLVGTPYCPDLQGAILLLEDVGEAPYRLDRMLTQLRLAGILQGLAGLALGIFRGCFVPEEMEASPTLEEIVLDAVADLAIPVVGAIPYGHMPNRLCLPIGVPARLETEPARLRLLDAAVT